MPNSLKCKIKHLCHNGTITERERDRILKALEHEPKTDTWSIKDVAETLAKHRLIADQEPKTGHWIKYGIPRCGEQHYKCTNCDEYFNFGLYSDYYKKAFKYCPHCGAKMVEPQESEE